MERRIVSVSGEKNRRKIRQMKCPYCECNETKVIDSRESQNGLTTRRRRECLSCHKRFTTYEKIEKIPYMVIKKDGKRQSFDADKLLKGLIKACEKRPVPVSELEEIVEEIESALQERPGKEISASEIGQIVMDKLKRLDKVAYVRFASVYREFKDVLEFKQELDRLLKEK
jgi:transcriptional repressor NrdR